MWECLKIFEVKPSFFCKKQHLHPETHFWIYAAGATTTTDLSIPSRPSCFPASFETHLVMAQANRRPAWPKIAYGEPQQYGTLHPTPKRACEEIRDHHEQHTPKIPSAVLLNALTACI